MAMDSDRRINFAMPGWNPDALDNLASNRWLLLNAVFFLFIYYIFFWSTYFLHKDWQNIFLYIFRIYILFEALAIVQKKSIPTSL